MSCQIQPRLESSATSCHGADSIAEAVTDQTPFWATTNQSLLPSQTTVMVAPMEPARRAVLSACLAPAW